MTKTLEENKLKTGQKITVIKISSMAITSKYELEIIEPLIPTRQGYNNEEERLAVAKQRGKRKTIYFDTSPGRGLDIVLNGWDLPLKVDSETGMFRGNACFNLVGDHFTIKELIENAAIPVTDEQKAKIIIVDKDNNETILYPEIGTSHAVINRLKGIK